MNTILFQVFLSIGILTMICVMIYLCILSWIGLSSTPREVIPMPQERAFKQEDEVKDMDGYKHIYLRPTRIREKTAFTMNVETLDMLRSVLQDLRERVSMASYLDNILREHLKSHRELLNQATAKQRRKTTITI
ncbi:MAG: DUF3408 domain-containing protein [Bacteroides pyogenes]|uniref:DUF3408 domain-containing protein n=1 Tax=Bacteroides pyogenes TaxID=310300 RepID=UPI003C6C277E|nr:DUF3408 domain-containing protein [Bacteroides pyogenes]